MRRNIVAVIALCLVVVPATTSSAHHRPNAYCSASGDICQSTAKVGGVRKFRILLRAKYFNWYHLCVSGHRVTVCTNFRIHRRKDGFYGDSVRWRRVFPDYGPGPYTVVWRLMSGDRVGRKLGFHRKARAG